MYETGFGRLPADEESRSARQFLKEQRRAHSKNAEGDEEADRVPGLICVMFVQC
jgi:hypothetical protein